LEVVYPPNKLILNSRMGGKMRAVALILLSLFIVSSLYAGITGKITGVVTDKETGKPIPYVNIIVVGTPFGAATDKNGRYVIINIPPGTYTVKASHVAYHTVTKTNVQVSADLTTVVNFVLTPKAIKGIEIVVTSTRPIVQRDVTASARILRGEDIERMPATDYREVVSTQLGAVETHAGLSGGLHIRGGRTGEVAYIVDGINVNDPVNMQPGIILDNIAIAEMSVYTGGFDAEYGHAMSGIVNIITKKGRDRPEFSLEYRTDAFIPRYSTKYNRVSLAFGLPLIHRENRKLTCFFSGNLIDRGSFELTKDNFDSFVDRILQDKHPPILPHNDLHNYSGTMKLFWQPISWFTSILSVDAGYRRWHSYDHSRMWGSWLKETPLYQRGNSRINLKITHTLSNRTFYELNIGYFNTYYKLSAQDGKHFNDWKAIGYRLPWVSVAVDSGWYDPMWQEWSPGWSAERAWMWYYENIKHYGYWDESTGKWYWVGDDTLEKLEHAVEALNDRYYEVNTWMIVDSTLVYHRFDINQYIEDVHRYLNGEITEDEMEPSGNMYLIRYNSGPWWWLTEGTAFAYYFYPIWHQRNTSKYIIKFSISSQIGDYHLVKLGGSLMWHDLRLTNIQFVNKNPYLDHYRKNPILADAYIQDKIEYEDLVLKPGIRIDYLDPRSLFYVKLDSLDAGKAWATPKIYVSPRFGILFAMTDRSKMYAHYGQFVQPVEFGEMYQNLEADITSGLPLIGNPNLPPEKTIAYEAGFQYAFTSDIALGITFYHKDVENLLASRQINTIWKKKLASYTIYVLEDYAVIKGIDIALIKRRSGLIYGTIGYSYQSAKGTGSSSREFYYRYRASGVEPPKSEYPLEFESPHTIKADIKLELPEGWGPTIFGIKPLSNLYINLIYQYTSGLPYTPMDKKGRPGMPGSKRLPPVQDLDMYVQKELHLGRLPLTIFLDIRNVPDWRYPVDVYATTGKPDDNGCAPVWDPRVYNNDRDFYNEVYRYWKVRVTNPAHFNAPRRIRVGIKITL